MIAGLVALVVLPTLYMLPSLIGWRRRARDLAKLAMFNLIAGATFLGWLYALGWAITAERKVDAAPEVSPPAQPPPGARWPLQHDWRLRRMMGLPYLTASNRWPTSEE